MIVSSRVADDGAADDPVRALVASHELERRRIARDLHDEVGQALTLIRLHLGLIQRDPSHVSSVVFEADRAVELVDVALREVRALAAGIRPAILDDLGLVGAARSSLARQARISGFRAEFESDVRVWSFGLEIDAACFGSLQEALTNVSRHAGATEVRVRLAETDDELVLEVSDDGLGFEPARIREQAPHGSGLGLLGLRERVELVGGSLSIRSAPHAGTTIRARFPLRGPLQPSREPR